MLGALNEGLEESHLQQDCSKFFQKVLFGSFDFVYTAASRNRGDN